MQRILMCPPDYFDIEYEINPWMHTENKVDKTKVQPVYKNIKSLYQSLGVEVYEIQPEKGLPDMVFPSNFGEVKHTTFIKSNFKYPQRRREADLAQKYFEETFGFSTQTLPEDIFFEGQGDLLNDGTRYFLGWGKRSDPRVKPYLEKYLNAEVIDFELINPYYYHLDTGFMPLSSEIVVYNPQSFTDEGKEKIHHSFKTLIETNDQDNGVMACNMVHINNHIAISAGISEELRKKLESLGYVLHEFDMTEYIKSGGSVKCISFMF